MTRAEWYTHWREERIKRRRPVPFIGSYVSILKELYDFQYTDNEEIFINLVERYRDKLPRPIAARKLNLVRVIRRAAKKRAAETFRHLVYGANPFLRLIPKEDFSGAFIPVPLKFGGSLCPK